MRKAFDSNGSRKVIFVIVLALLLAIVLAAFVNAAWTDRFSGLGDKFSGLSGNKWIVILVNGAVLAGLGYIGSTLLNTGANKIDDKQIKTIQLALVGVGLLIAYQIYESGVHDLLWKIPAIKDFMHLRVLVNLALVAGLLYLLYTWLDLKPKEQKDSKIFDVMIFGVILLIAFNAVKPMPSYSDKTYHYIWEWESIVPYRFALLGDSNCVYYDMDGNGWQDPTMFGNQYWKDKNGDKYYYDKDSTNWYKTRWYWFDPVVEDQEKINNELNLAKEVKDTNIDELKSEDREPFIGKKTRLTGFASERSRVDRYCYTQESINEFLGQKSKGEDYNPKYKEPKLEEIKNTGGFGIFRGMHLIMLIIGMLIISWVMQVWEIIKTGNQKLTYSLSFIFAAMIAHSGVSMQGFGWLMQILLLFAFFKMFGGDPKNFKSGGTWFAIIASLLIVNSLINAVKPEYSLPVIGWFTIGSLYGSFPSPMAFIVGILEFIGLAYLLFFSPLRSKWYISVPLAIVIYFGINFLMPAYSLDHKLALKYGGIGIIIAFIVFLITTGLSPKARLIGKRITKYWLQRLIEWRNESEWLARLGWNKRFLPETHNPELLPFYIMQNLPLFYHVMNLCKRTWIYHQYWAVVKGIIEDHDGKPAAIKEINTEIDRFGSLSILKQQIIDYRSSPSNLNAKYIYKLKNAGKDADIEEEKDWNGGWGGHHQTIAKLYNECMELLYKTEAAIKIDDIDALNKYIEEIGVYADRFGTIKGEIEDKYNGFIERLNAYSYHSFLKSKMMTALLMANSAGFYPHSYVFARPDAKCVKVKLDKDGNTEEIPGAPEEVVGRRKGTWYWEVDGEGKFLDDINEHVAKWNDVREAYEGNFLKYRNTLPTIRKLTDITKTVSYMENLGTDNSPQKILTYMDAEWEMWIRDMTFGQFHNLSRTYDDYFNAYEKKIFHDEHISKTFGASIDLNNPSFDMRVLSNPGKFNYWGRKEYNTTTETSAYKDNPIPWISVWGATKYLKYKFDKEFKEEKEKIEWGSMFPSGAEVQNLEDHTKVMGLLAERFKGAQNG